MTSGDLWKMPSTAATPMVTAYRPELDIGPELGDSMTDFEEQATVVWFETEGIRSGSLTSYLSNKWLN